MFCFEETSSFIFSSTTEILTWPHRKLGVMDPLSTPSPHETSATITCEIHLFLCRMILLQLPSYWAVWFCYNYHHTVPYIYLWLTDCHYSHHAVYHLLSPATNHYLPDPDRAFPLPIYSTITTIDNLVLWSPYPAITGVPQILTHANNTCCYNDQHCLQISDYMLPSMLSTNTTLWILKMLFCYVLVLPSPAAPT